MLSDAEKRELLEALSSIRRITRANEAELRIAKAMNLEQRKPREVALMKVLKVESDLRMILVEE
jgi:hypothetical protein